MGKNSGIEWSPKLTAAKLFCDQRAPYGALDLPVVAGFYEQHQEVLQL
jgi:hypothetical protein